MFTESMVVSKPGKAKGKRAVAAGILSKGAGFKKGKKTFNKKAALFLRKSGKK